eukprot:g9623.t1
MDDGNIGIPTNIKNEWLILETYQQVMADEKQAEEDRRAQSAIQRFKQDLDKQIQLNKSRSEEEKRDAEARKEQQRKQLEEHEAHQKELKESSRRKLLEEKCVRASQILDNERRRARERQEQKLDDARLLAECKQKLAEEKEAQLQKRNEVARLLREMNRENVAKLALREKQKLKEAEEDKRLMKEYQERLDREQAERAAAHKKRLERYEMIGNQWAEFGAGKKQHDKDVAEERRVLAEAAIKEKADQDREKRDKEALRADRLRCLEDNKRLMDEKVARKKAEDLLEAKYAQQFRSEGEEHAAKDVARKNQMLRQKQDHARKLKDQMRATRAALKTVQMTDTERQMNGDLLRQLQENRDLQEKIRLLCVSLFASARGSASTAGTGGGAGGGRGLAIFEKRPLAGGDAPLFSDVWSSEDRGSGARVPPGARRGGRRLETAASNRATRGHWEDEVDEEREEKTWRDESFHRNFDSPDERRQLQAEPTDDDSYGYSTGWVYCSEYECGDDYENICVGGETSSTSLGCFENCCVGELTCGEFTFFCDGGTFNPDASCGYDGSCDATECCDPDGVDCSTYTGGCYEGLTLDPSNTCAGSVCTEQECCVNSWVLCDDYECGDGYVNTCVLGEVEIYLGETDRRLQSTSSTSLGCFEDCCAAAELTCGNTEIDCVDGTFNPNASCGDDRRCSTTECCVPDAVDCSTYTGGCEEGETVDPDNTLDLLP